MNTKEELNSVSEIKDKKQRTKTMTNTSQNSQKSDRYRFQDYQEIIKQQNNTFSYSHSLCMNCSDYYDVPPCQTNLTANGSCFPSLTGNDDNLN